MNFTPKQKTCCRFGEVRKEIQLLLNESFGQNLELWPKIQSQQSPGSGGTKLWVRQA
jgi:hypothetical protein